MAQIKAGANDFWEARALRRSFIHWHRTFDGMPRARTQGNPAPGQPRQHSPGVQPSGLWSDQGPHLPGGRPPASRRLPMYASAALSFSHIETQ